MSSDPPLTAAPTTASASREPFSSRVAEGAAAEVLA